ncbi:MAG TPA: hypothetical protein DEA08_36285 [Planctomycetes bacterium]|nr:hypothetical protein [Planctomycetota bacterium]
MNERERGGALILVLITLAVVALLVEGIVVGSRTESSATSATTARVRGFYAAQAGIWAASHDLGSEGSGGGQVNGNVTRADYDVVAAPADAFDELSRSAGSDGFPDFSDDAFFLAQADGYYEARSVDVDGGDTYRVRAKAKVDGELRLLEAVVVREPVGYFPWRYGVFSDETLTLSSNPKIDSYSSSAGSYSSQVTPGPNAHANEQGSVGSNGDIVLSANVDVWGDANPGPSKAVTIPGSSSVAGSTTPLSNAQDMPAPTWTVPPASDCVTSNGYDVPLNRTSPGITTLGPGRYVFSSINVDHVGAVVRLEGTASDTIEIYITGGAAATDDPSLWIEKGVFRPAYGGTVSEGLPTVKIYNVGKVSLESGPTMVGSPSGGAPKLQYFSSYTSDLSDSSDLGVELRSNVAFFGAIYAPGAAVEINSHARIYGSVSGKQVFVDSNAKIHYDEDLANVSTDSSPASRFKVDVLRTIR